MPSVKQVICASTTHSWINILCWTSNTIPVSFSFIHWPYIKRIQIHCMAKTSLKFKLALFKSRWLDHYCSDYYVSSMWCLATVLLPLNSFSFLEKPCRRTNGSNKINQDVFQDNVKMHQTQIIVNTRSWPNIDAPLDGNNITTFISFERCINSWSRSCIDNAESTAL